MSKKDLSKLPTARGWAYFVSEQNGKPVRHSVDCSACPPLDYSSAKDCRGEVVPIYRSRRELLEAGWRRVSIPTGGKFWCCPECSKESE